MRSRAAELEGKLKGLRIEHEEVKKYAVDEFKSKDLPNEVMI